VEERFNDQQVAFTVVEGVAIDVMDLHTFWGIDELAVHTDVMVVTVFDNTPGCVGASVRFN
jgi:hypothetical protein